VTSSTERSLIVNADDFGFSHGVNRGIAAAHEHGIVTSASLMVRGPATAAAAGYARMRPALGLGLHVDLGEWFFRNGEWVPLYEVVPLDDPDAVAVEVQRQFASFRRLLGRDPTHLDSHQHVHRTEPLASILAELARALGVPLRHRTRGVRHEGRFYGQTGDGTPLPAAISVDALLRIIAELPFGVTELGCHPGLDDDIVSMYRRERRREVETLCDPRVRRAIETGGIRLCSFDRIAGVA
jgi:predicted glycoside hydrolase/deacetylase ChbG (UPF0249 family)